MKPNKIAPVAFGLLLAATPALFAQEAGPDTDGDGMVTLEEFTAAYPDLTAEAFDAADTNADGMLDADEIAAAAEAGVLPATES
ncbi:MAG: EF-hand domain-containing protein [Paracoccaceae bacterium]|nr:EF-hand domain-containing protein [Maritimibacter sp.]